MINVSDLSNLRIASRMGSNPIKDNSLFKKLYTDCTGLVPGTDLSVSIRAFFTIELK